MGRKSAIYHIKGQVRFSETQTLSLQESRLSITAVGEIVHFSDSVLSGEKRLAPRALRAEKKKEAGDFTVELEDFH